MGSILARFLVCSAVVLSAGTAFAVGGFSSTDLIDTDQNQALVQGLQADLSLDRSALSPFTYKLASVHFIVGSNGQTFDTSDNDFSDPTGDYCKRYGFNVTSCPSGLFNQACPYNDKIYDRCCDSTYIYTPSQCSTPKKLSADSCGGKYKCLCDTSAYPYSTCNDPQIRGNECSDETGTHYASCTCPADNNGPWGCKEYYAAPCNSVCKTPWTDNCRNLDHKDVGYGCAKWWGDCSSKCEIPYTDNCRNRNHNDYGHGCQQWWYDCSSKCEIPYTDGCRNHNAVISSCPTNATCQTFSDCSSKISSWSCNSGYKKSGDNCVTAAPTCAEYEQTHGRVYSYAQIRNILSTSGSPTIITHEVINTDGGYIDVDVVGESVTVSECHRAPTSDTCYVCSCDYTACNRINEESCRVDGGSYYGWDSWVDCADYTVQQECDEGIWNQCAYYSAQ